MSVEQVGTFRKGAHASLWVGVRGQVERVEPDGHVHIAGYRLPTRVGGPDTVDDESPGMVLWVSSEDPNVDHEGCTPVDYDGTYADGINDERRRWLDRIREHHDRDHEESWTWCTNPVCASTRDARMGAT